MCLSVTTLAATYLVYMSKVRRYTVSYRHYIVWTSLKTFCLGDMALFACHDMTMNVVVVILLTYGTRYLKLETVNKVEAWKAYKADMK